ncbi:alpha/beta hydrolase [Metabacillus malikii]|uniref:Enterochelin esterase-like enzyme n=1 Tax=Metabacillus malikii TaxID=1504265 RepID=A0ABT9ZGJ2_9BACI|nr:alpha/beta hydrolase-fold protein [Metabacillus malikii]MDQ0230658.1 enterochelin esterase-like enzyme [Metabacillus malikii]
MAKQTGRIKELLFYSDALEEEVPLIVYLSEDFSDFSTYTLLIAQDGQDYFRLGRIGRQAESLMKMNEIENIIIVGIPYKNVNDRRDKYHPSSPKSEKYQQFLSLELVPFLDRKFPTHQVAEGRALIGDSLGATISLLTGLAYPNTFSKLILQSPYVDESVIKAVEGYASGQHLTIFHQIGIQETTVKTTDGSIQDFLTPNRKLNKILESKQFTYKYEEFAGDHTWKYWQPALTPILREMFL